MLNFCHTYLYFKDLIRTDFCGIYAILWDLIKDKNSSFQSLYYFDLAVCLSAGPVDRGRGRSTGLVDRRAQNAHAAQAGRPVDRVGRPSKSFCSLEMASVDRQRALLSFSSFRSTGVSTIIIMTVGRSTAQSTERAILPFPAANGQIYFGAYIPHFLSCFIQVFQEQNSYSF